MPPKRKAGGTNAAAGGKKSKPSTVKDAITALKKADKGKVRNRKVDSLHMEPYLREVFEDCDCMLNQTNIGNNNNKFYVIQVLKTDGDDEFWCWTRWGRVGEPGQNKEMGPFSDSAAAIKEFMKKFKDKTKNDWNKRDVFKPVPGKYTLIEMDDDEDSDEEITEEKVDDVVDGITQKCSLDKETEKLVKLIFDEDMFRASMQKMDLDVKKMPLGKLSKSQIAKGFEVLEELETAIKGKKKAKFDELTSKFYTVIPHNFGRQRPPVISDLETIRKKMDMLLVLGDIELAQDMQKDTTKGSKGGKVEHPLDHKYKLLQCELDLLDKKSKEYKVIQKYMDKTGDDYLKLLQVWKVDRKGENERFSSHKNIKNRKLLWHGTDTAVVAAILKTGLRIMPHSGGRVGRGIYFASENSKSSGYVGTSCVEEDNEEIDIGIMFLNEVALGKEYSITEDDSSLVKAPNGYDSVVARGENEPDKSADTSLSLDGNKVIVPQGAPKAIPQYKDSCFDQSEYLIYKESQNRIRYLLKIAWGDW